MKKGQAAIEFLTTYGWAILVLLIVLAVLFTSGILSPNYLVSEECDFGTNMPCSFALFNQVGSTKLSLRLFNGFAYKIQVNGVQLQTQDGTQTFSWNGGSFPVDLESGQNVTLTGTLSGSAIPESSIKRFVGNLTYVSCAPEINATACSTLNHTVTGRVVGKVISQ